MKNLNRHAEATKSLHAVDYPTRDRELDDRLIDLDQFFNVSLYFAVFLEKLVKANINVLMLVLSPRINIHPGIVEIQTTLKSPIGRLVLANSITLTPGTLVVDIKGDTLFIHWINVSSKDPVSAIRQIAGRFEKYLKVIYG